MNQIEKQHCWEAFDRTFSSRDKMSSIFAVWEAAWIEARRPDPYVAAYGVSRDAPPAVHPMNRRSTIRRATDFHDGAPVDLTLLLTQAKQQIEYFQGRFTVGGTVAGNACIRRLDEAISEIGKYPTKEEA